jgi:hypothetical protein
MRRRGDRETRGYGDRDIKKKIPDLEIGDTRSFINIDSVKEKAV